VDARRLTHVFRELKESTTNVFRSVYALPPFTPLYVNVEEVLICIKEPFMLLTVSHIH